MPKKDIDVKLNIELGGSGTSALDKLKKSLEETKAAEASLKKSGQAVAGMSETLGQLGIGGGRQMGQVHGFAQGLSGAGFSKTGAALGKAAGPIGAGIAGVDFAAKATVAFSDPYATSQQSLRGIARELPGGKTVQGWHDAFTGRAADMTRIKVGEQTKAVHTQLSERLTQFSQSYYQEQRGKESEAKGMANTPAILMGPQDRMSVTGERHYQERSRLIPVERELARLKVQESRAAQEVSVAQHFYNQQIKRTGELEVRRTDILAKLEDKNSGPNRVRLQTELADVQNQLIGGAENTIGLKQNLARTTERQAQAVAQTQMGQADIHQARAQNLEARAQDSLAGAGRLGGMKQADRMSALQSMKLLIQHGPEMLSDEQISEARSVDAKQVQSILDRYGAATEEYAQFAATPGSSFAPDGPEATFAKSGKEQDLADSMKHTAAQTLSAASAAAGKEIGDAVLEQLEIIKDETIKQIHLGQRIGVGYQ